MLLKDRNRRCRKRHRKEHNQHLDGSTSSLYEYTFPFVVMIQSEQNVIIMDDKLLTIYLTFFSVVHEMVVHSNKFAELHSCIIYILDASQSV